MGAERMICRVEEKEENGGEGRLDKRGACVPCVRRKPSVILPSVLTKKH